VSETVTSADGRPLSKRGERTRRKLLEAAEDALASLVTHAGYMEKFTQSAPHVDGAF
jgi:hypothetical protein